MGSLKEIFSDVFNMVHIVRVDILDNLLEYFFLYIQLDFDDGILDRWRHERFAIHTHLMKEVLRVVIAHLGESQVKS
jgi:hypothetical protein